MTPGPARDNDVLRQIATRRFLTRVQLQELLLAGSALTPRSREVVTWRVLGRLQRLGLVDATTRHAGGLHAGSGAPAYYLTTSGLRRVALSLPDLPRRRPAARGSFLLMHSLLANEIELCFRRTARVAANEELQLWESDWQIAMQLGEGTSIVPDARFVYRCGQKRLHAFLEVDVGTEGTRYFAKKIPRYLDLYRSSAWRTFIPVWPLVLTVTPTDTRAQSLCSATYASLRYEYARPQTGSTFRFISIDELRAGDALRVAWRVPGAATRLSLTDLAAVEHTVANDASRAIDTSTMPGGRSGAGSEEDVTAPREPSEVDGPAR